MDPTVTFYQTLSGTSFTLLGLWFGVMQFAHGNWRSDPDRHAATLHLALKFFLPGVLGLASMLGTTAGDNGLVWRATFAIGGAIGLVESLRYVLRTGRARVPGRRLAVLDPLLYALVVAAAFVPAGALAISPLQIEGIVTGLLFITGLCGVWLAFAERASESSTTATAPTSPAATPASTPASPGSPLPPPGPAGVAAAAPAGPPATHAGPPVPHAAPPGPQGPRTAPGGPPLPRPEPRPEQMRNLPPREDPRTS